MEDIKKVYFEKCSEYDVDKIEKIIRDSLIYLNIKIPFEKKILLKPNVLGVYNKDKHVTTNPAVIEAIVRILLENKNTIIIGDSSGARIKGGTDEALAASGIKALERENVKVVSFDSGKLDKYENPDNKILKNVVLTGYIKDCDYIINLPKLKSHTFTRYTGAVKNFFGCIPGGIKQRCHAEAPNQKVFAELLIDLYSFIKPKIFLNIMDGIIGLEGKGPGPSGIQTKTNIIAISQDALALDFFCCDYIKADPLSINTNKSGVARGFFNGKYEKNNDIEKINFILPKVMNIPDFIYKYCAGFTYPKPFLDKLKCKKCAICANACPIKAITMNPYPEFDRKRCIYCFCCHENCPAEAIELKDNIFLRTYKKFTK